MPLERPSNVNRDRFPPVRFQRVLLSALLTVWVATLLACGGVGNKPSGKDAKQAQGKDEPPAKKDGSKKPSEPSAKDRWIAAGCPSLDLVKLKAGDIGAMPVAEYVVSGEKKTRPTGWKVLQIIDGKNALMTHIDGYYKELNGETFWLENGTSSLVDGRSYTFDGIWECTGTRRYNTPAGATRTVFVLCYRGEQ